MVPLTSTVTRWFTARRGLVVALANCGIGLGGMVFAPLTRYLIMDLGWRTAFLLYAVLAWSLVLSLALLIRNRPQDLGLSPLGDAAAAPVSPPGYPFRAVITTSAFWRLAGIHFLCCAAHSGPIFHMVSAAIDHGIDKLAAATVFGLASLASIPGRIGTGLLADRFGSRRVLVLWLAMQASAILLYRRSGSLASFVLLALYFGVAYGGVMPLYAVVTREFFGARAMGSSYGAIFLLSCFGMGFGGWVGGRLFDVTGTYSAMYLLSFGLATAGALLAVALRPPAAGRRRAAQWQPATTT
ncbi:MAG: hypothetical protein KatS3mg131_1695 [Candidatus Tectimicrobiota bacterium]|nr:MAG: hypothetical protein KatS3mg131_1695 [Candidatus Tectomicrobia bacterium]